MSLENDLPVVRPLTDDEIKAFENLGVIRLSDETVARFFEGGRNTERVEVFVEKKQKTIVFPPSQLKDHINVPSAGSREIESTPGYDLLAILEAVFSEKIYERVLQPQFAEIEDDYHKKLNKGINKRWLDIRANAMLFGTVISFLNPLRLVSKLLDIGNKIE